MVGIAARMARRIAGPVYQFNKVLETFARGESGVRIQLRKNDEFTFLADRINTLLDEAQKSRERKAKVG
jgi:methyl-accepting chemotaxis protein